MKSRVGMFAYGALFSLMLPAALLAWMHRLDVLLRLPVAGPPLAGIAAATAGIAVMAAAVGSLWFFGRGLPMSPYPAEQYVRKGVYAIVADPLYLGAVLTCAGVGLALQSPAGVWIVTPVLALAAVAFVWGFERELTVSRFGSMPAPWLRLPPAGDERPTFRDIASFELLVLLPWLIIYEGISRVAKDTPAWLTYLPGEQQWPVIAWTEPIYAAAYPVAVLIPFVCRSRRDLRQLALRGLGATVGIGLFYLLVPLIAPYKPAPAGSIWTPLLLLERTSDQRACSLPSFHVLWAWLAADVIIAWRPKLRGLAYLMAVAISVSCVTTGMHSLLDVIFGVLAYGLVTRAYGIWLWLVRAAEAVANSWREWPVGPLRVMSHGVYAAAGGAAGAALALWLAGPAQVWWITGLTLGAELGAGIWAQVVEGSPVLLRPYGYFGSVLAVIALAGVAGLSGADGWLLLAAMSVGACVTQILGRMRCLVQGCCHGRSTEATWGIRHVHPRSRVVRLSDLGGRPVHPTALYSMAWTFVVGLILLRLWSLEVPLPFIPGTYLILIGVGRFVEEHYRGEPQTKQILGLRLYQWLAIAFVIGGALLTCVSGAPAPAPAAPAPVAWPILAIVFVLTYMAYGVDFPRSNKRFSRLV